MELFDQVIGFQLVAQCVAEPVAYVTQAPMQCIMGLFVYVAMRSARGRVAELFVCVSMRAATLCVTELSVDACAQPPTQRIMELLVCVRAGICEPGGCANATRSLGAF